MTNETEANDVGLTDDEQTRRSSHCYPRSVETGPIYGIQLLDALPLGMGSMSQALPSRDDLESVKSYRQGQRVVAGYEVVLMHWRREKGIANVLADKLAQMTGRTVPQELKDAAIIVDRGED